MFDNKILALGLISTFCALTLTVSCSKDSASPPQEVEEEEDNNNGDVLELRREVLRQAAEHVIFPTYQSFLTDAKALEQASQAWSTSGSSEDRAKTQEAWKKAAATWQEAEMMQVGPTGLSSAVLAGADLRDEFYSWPLVNRCRVDQEVVEAVFEDPDLFATEKVNVRGLDAMEYLLFTDSSGNACRPTSRINRDGDWANLSAEEIKSRRAGYTHTLAVLLVRQGEDLVQRWSPTGQDFVSQLANAGNGSTTYTSTQSGLNALSDSLFYVDTDTKDHKIGRPAGLSECDEEVCPETLESVFAHRSREHVLHNLIGFRRLFTGGDAPDAPGFDDLLIEAGAEDVSQDMLKALDDVVAQIQALDKPWVQVLGEDPALIRNFYDALKKLTDILKTDFISILDLELPKRVEGDND